MAYGHWRIGLDLRRDAMVCIALQKRRSGWALRRWWQQEDAPEITDEARIATLRLWRREMPNQHSTAIALSAAGTLKRTLSVPGLALRDSEQAQWIVNSVAQQLEMAAEALAFDYCNTAENNVSVTAARRQDVDRLLSLAAAAGLKVKAVTPDACALQHYLDWLPPGYGSINWFDGEAWLWATATDWGRSPEPLADALRCGGGSFDPWSCLNQLYPPLPEKSERFTVALALALGER